MSASCLMTQPGHKTLIQLDAVHLSPFAFLVSATALSDLINHILPAGLQLLAIPNLNWSWQYLSSGSAAGVQKTWNTYKMGKIAHSQLEVGECYWWCDVYPTFGFFSPSVGCLAWYSSPVIVGPNDGWQHHYWLELGFNFVSSPFLPALWGWGGHFRYSTLNDIFSHALLFSVRFYHVWNHRIFGWKIARWVDNDALEIG